MASRLSRAPTGRFPAIFHFASRLCSPAIRRPCVSEEVAQATPVVADARVAGLFLHVRGDTRGRQTVRK